MYTPAMSKETPWTARRAVLALILVLLVLVLLGSRLALVWTSTATPDDFWPGLEAYQFRAARDFCVANPPLQNLSWFLETRYRYYFPIETEFHGVVLLNALLTLPFACTLGVQPAAGEALALCYAAVAMVLWALFVRRHLGGLAMLFFAALFLVPPPRLVTTSMYLMGSHVEGITFCALLFWLAFRQDRPVIRYGIFIAAGPLLFLYKGVVFPLVVLVPIALVRLPGWWRRVWALVLGALACLPMVLLARKFGFYGHHLQDASYVPGDSPPLTWWNVFEAPGFRLDELVSGFAMGLEPMANGVLKGWMYLTIFAVAAVVLLAIGAPRAGPTTENPAPRSRLVIATLVLYPLLHGLALAVSSLPPHQRYYLPLYPVTMVIIAGALAALPRKVGIPAFVVLLGLLVQGNLSYLRHGPWMVIW